MFEGLKRFVAGGGSWEIYGGGKEALDGGAGGLWQNGRMEWNGSDWMTEVYGTFHACYYNFCGSH